MFLAALAVVLFPPDRGSPDLAGRIKGYREHEPPAAVRLADANLATNKRILTEFRDDPAFAALPEDLQDFVADRLQEIEDYQAYRGKLAVAMAPGDTRTLEDLQRIEQALTPANSRCRRCRGRARRPINCARSGWPMRKRSARPKGSSWSATRTSSAAAPPCS